MKTNAEAGTGSVGGAGAWELPGVAASLLFAIGESGSYSGVPYLLELPDDGKYSAKETGGQIAGREWAVRSIFINALQSSLDVLGFSRKEEGFTIDNLKDLDHLVRINRAHMLELFSLKRDLKSFYKSVNDKSKSTREAQGTEFLKNEDVIAN